MLADFADSCFTEAPIYWRGVAHASFRIYWGAAMIDDDVFDEFHTRL